MSIGHNPLGAWSVFAMLLFLIIQVSSGLFSDDEIANAGPLVKFVDSSLISYATYYHKAIGKLILFSLVTLHIGAILFYYFKKKDDLVTPMIMGMKVSEMKVPSSKDTVQSRLLAAVIYLMISAVVAYFVQSIN